MLIKIVSLILLLGVPSLYSQCSTNPGCFHTRLYICCYFAKLNDLPHTVSNLTKHLSLAKDNITNLSADMFRRNNLLGLESVSLIETGTRTLESRTFQGLNDLRKIIISKNELETILPYTFDGVPFLSYLDLTNNKISMLSPRAFYGLRMLRLLDFTYNQLATLSADMFEGMKPENLTEAQKTAASFRTSRKLIFSFSTIETVNPGAFQYVSFTDLELTADLLHSIAVLEKNVFRDIKNLHELKLRGIAKISRGAFSGLKSLVKLHLEAIVIPLIDDETFKDLINLKELDISHYSTSKLRLAKGAFKNLTKLVYLSLDVLGIQSISSGVFTSLGMLQILKVTRQEIHALNNDVFYELHNLVELNLRQNNIETLGIRSFNGLLKLRKLSLQLNKLKTFNSNIWDKVFITVTNITYLFVDSYLITDEPNLLKNFTSLKTLSIEGNVTMDLLKTTGNLKLEHIRISRSLSKIDIDFLKNFNGLRELKTEFSVIKYIKPGEFCPLSGLLKLSITFGQLTVIEPGAFYGLRQLKELKLIRNKLNEIQEGAFGRVSQRLSTLIQNNYSITNNCETPEGLVALETLSLAYNNISFIHRNAFKGNANLKKIDLSYNRVVTLEFMVEVRKSVYQVASILDDLKNLKNLILYRNQIVTLRIRNFQNNQALQNLSIALNPLKCDCEMKKFWLWMEKSRIKSDDTPWCKGKPQDWSDILATLRCQVNEIPPSLLKVHTDEDITILQVYVAPAVLAAIISIGAFGNILLVLIFILNSDMRSGPNVYIMNLTVADILNLVVNLPLSFVDNISKTWSLGNVMCQIFMFMRDFSVGLSVYSVVALGIQRYVVIVHPLKYREGKFGFFKGCGAFFHIVAVWILAVIFALPSVLSATLQGSRCLNAATKYGQEYMRTVWTAQLIVYCVVPIILILIMYCWIAILLRRNAQPGETQGNRQARQRTKLADMVVVLTAVFCISYVPNFLVRVLVAWSVMDQYTTFTLYTSFISYCLFFSNTCFNPFALYLMSSRFRELFKRYLFFWHKIAIFSPYQNKFERLHTVEVTTEDNS